MKTKLSIIFSLFFNMSGIFTQTLADNQPSIEEQIEEDETYDEELLERLKKEAIEAKNQLDFKKEEETFTRMGAALKDPKQMDAFGKEFSHHNKEASSQSEWKKRKASSAAAFIASAVGLGTVWLAMISPYKKRVNEYMEQKSVKAEKITAAARYTFEFANPDSDPLKMAQNAAIAEFTKKKDALSKAALKDGIGATTLKRIHTETIVLAGANEAFIEILKAEEKAKAAAK